jgi:hypothetical protein
VQRVTANQQHPVGLGRQRFCRAGLRAGIGFQELSVPGQCLVQRQACLRRQRGGAGQQRPGAGDE